MGVSGETVPGWALTGCVTPGRHFALSGLRPPVCTLAPSGTSVALNGRCMDTLTKQTEEGHGEDRTPQPPVPLPVSVSQTLQAPVGRHVSVPARASFWPMVVTGSWFPVARRPRSRREVLGLGTCWSRGVQGLPCLSWGCSQSWYTLVVTPAEGPAAAQCLKSPLSPWRGDQPGEGMGCLTLGRLGCVHWLALQCTPEAPGWRTPCSVGAIPGSPTGWCAGCSGTTGIRHWLVVSTKPFLART